MSRVKWDYQLWVSGMEWCCNLSKSISNFFGLFPFKMGIYIYHTPNQGDLGVQRNLGVGPTHSFSKFGLLLYFLNFQTLYWHTADQISDGDHFGWIAFPKKILCSHVDLINISRHLLLKEKWKTNVTQRDALSSQPPSSYFFFFTQTRVGQEESHGYANPRSFPVTNLYGPFFFFFSFFRFCHRPSNWQSCTCIMLNFSHTLLKRVKSTHLLMSR